MQTSNARHAGSTDRAMYVASPGYIHFIAVSVGVTACTRSMCHKAVSSSTSTSSCRLSFGDNSDQDFADVSVDIKFYFFIFKKLGTTGSSFYSAKCVVFYPVQGTAAVRIEYGSRIDGGTVLAMAVRCCMPTQ